VHTESESTRSPSPSGLWHLVDEALGRQAEAEAGNCACGRKCQKKVSEVAVSTLGQRIQAAIKDLNDDRPRPVLSGCTAAEVYLRDRIALPDRAQIKKEVEQTKATLMAQAASRDEHESAGRRAVEAVLSRYGYLEFRGTMSTNSQAAGREE